MISRTRKRISIHCVFLLPVLFGQGWTADPPHYKRQATWHDTLLVSLEELERRGMEEGFPSYESDILRGGDPARQVGIDISGANEMFLLVTGDPDKVWGVADWGEAKLIAPGGTVTNLSRFRGVQVLKGRHDIDINLHSGLYEPMKILKRKFEHGLHVQADSVVRVRLEKRFERFESWIGIDAWAGKNGNVRFSILGARAAARRMLWDLAARDFPTAIPRREMRWELEDRMLERAWRAGDAGDLARRYAAACHRVPPLAIRAGKLAPAVRDISGLAGVRRLYLRSREIDDALARARSFNFRALQLAIEDLWKTRGEQYPEGARYLEQLSNLKKRLSRALGRLAGGGLKDFQRVEQLANGLLSLKRKALLDNPLLRFDRLLLIKRKPMGEPRRSQWGDRGLGEYLGLPRQSSWGISTIPNPLSWDNEIAILSPVRPEGALTTIFKPRGRKLVTELDLHFQGDRILFSMPDDRRRWQIHEIAPDGTGLRQITPGDQPDVHSYDACYLPDGRIAFISTAVMQGVPCNASVIVGMMYRMNPDGTDIQQICYEQDHDYYPSVLNDGRILYLRWDYTDTPHIWNRLLMAMNPDGTSQMEYYGSNSYWPNAFFFARAIPGHPTRIVTIVTGHHESRDGELVIFDPVKGRQETQGVVQRIPGYGKRVEPVIDDKPTEHSWPKFLYPWPLSEKYFIVSCKPDQDSLWGIYLVDIFDNMVLLREEENHVLLEPIPLRSRPTPPVIPDRVKPGRDAMVHLVDVYQGPGLRGIPRGTVKNLRLFTYHFGYQTLAGIDHRVGADGPWEVKRVLGTVPVEADGSAFFRIPARTPISVQPLDAGGRALALMRSWMTAMPGETLSCVGCHESLTGAPLNRQTLAASRPPSGIQPWYGPARGFSFRREVQPVLDRYCVGCHNGDPAAGGSGIPDLRKDRGGYTVFERGNPDGRFVQDVPRKELFRKYGGVFEPSYIELFRFLRTGGLESDLHVLPPKEFHAGTQELIQMLEKGHHGVQLDGEAWDRLITWIDLNAPCHGTWEETTRLPGNQRERRLFLRRLYGGLNEDGEVIPDIRTRPVNPVIPGPPTRKESEPVTCPGWPFDAAEAGRRQAAAGSATRRTVDLGGGVAMEFVLIPAGSFVMGGTGAGDERPLTPVRIDQPFWMACHEVTNEQYRRFDPAHDSRFEHRTSWIFSEAYIGWRLDGPKQPVVRVAWSRAMAFCRWLSERTGEKVTLPTEAQWEYACRAGSAAPLFYGDLNSDFSPFANVADRTIRNLAYEGWRPKSPDLVPRDPRFDDGALVTAEVGRYRPNAWGLHDMHGNAAEWTRSTYRPYPYRGDDGRNDLSGSEKRVVRGGSWRDRPGRCRSAFRLGYPPYQRIYNVGFRVILGEGARLVQGSP